MESEECKLPVCPDGLCPINEVKHCPCWDIDLIANLVIERMKEVDNGM